MLIIRHVAGGRASALLTVAFLTAQTGVPRWLQAPGWLRPFNRALGHFVHDHQAAGLFLVIFVEELGVPLPAPGDVAIALGGYLTTTGDIPYPFAFAAVVAGATLGSFCLFLLCRRFGHPFLLRFGPYVGLDAVRVSRVERSFRRWGPLAIIVGRHIPGMRIVLSAFAGVFEIPPKVFVLSVFVSACAWALIFLEVGRVLGRNSRFLFRLIPAHLLPLLFLLGLVLAALWLSYEHGWRRRPAGAAPSRQAHGQDPQLSEEDQPEARAGKKAATRS